MRCAACGTDNCKPPGSFTITQKKKPAAARKCSACAATTADTAAAASDPGAGGNAPAQPAAVGVPVASRAAGSSAEASASTSGAAGPTTTRGSSASPGAAEAAATTADADPSAAASRKFCDWAGCGRQLPADPAEYSKCGRCKQAFYCDRTCQKRHWGRGGHKEACAEPPCCTICLDGGDDPVPIQCGCACRGDGGLAHIACRAEVAARKEAGFHEGWHMCPTCGQQYTGAMELGLAREAVSRLRTRRRDDYDRLAAADNLGGALRCAGELAEAADVLAGVLAAAKRVCGKEHPSTLGAATNLAATCSDQGQLTEAAELQGWVLKASRRVNGKSHMDTHGATANLAATYARQPGQVCRGRGPRGRGAGGDAAGARRGAPGHARAAISLAVTHKDQGKLAEAVQ